ncbi:uncharacterized protein KZ484_023953 [Pholidichthys leucotaenia]
MFSFFPLISINSHYKRNSPTHSQGEDLERNDGSSERPYFMSPELHDILSKSRPVEEDRDGVDQADANAKQMDEVKVEEEMPLQQQQDGEIQLKEQTVVKQDNEEQKPLQSNADTEKANEEKEEQKASEAGESDKKNEAEVKDAEEKKEQKTEEKTEVLDAAVEAEKGETDEKKEQQPEKSTEDNVSAEKQE